MTQIVKTNRLIQARYTLGIVEQRILLLAMAEARETGDGIKDGSLLHIRAADYAAEFGVSKQAALSALSSAVKTLFNRRFTIRVFDEKLKEEIEVTERWITSMSYIQNRAQIALRFNSVVSENFIRIDGNYTEYKLETVKDLNSIYSVRLYELLAESKNKSKRVELSLKDFRELMGLEPDQYTASNDLKKRVLDLAVNQINKHTDFTCEYEQQKDGRMIAGFIFKIKFKQSDAPKIAAPKKTKNEPKLNTAFAGLERLNFQNLQKKYATLTEEYIRNLAKAENKSTFEIINKMIKDSENNADFKLEHSL